mgnify:FL=1
MKVSKLKEFNREQIEKNFRQRIKGLSSVFGPSGFEEEVAELIKQNLADSDFTHSTDVLGNLIYHRKGTGDKKILIAVLVAAVAIVATIFTFFQRNLGGTSGGAVAYVDTISNIMGFSGGGNDRYSGVVES